MKIGVDLRSLQTGHEFRGIGMYVRSVTEQLFLQGIDRDHEVIFYYYDSTNPLQMINLPKNSKYKSIIIKNPKKPSAQQPKTKRAINFATEVLLNNFRWSPVPETNKLDAFIQFDQQLGLPRNPFIKKILVVHDLIPIVFRRQYLPPIMSIWHKHDWKMALKTLGLNTRYKLGLRHIKRADRIIAISNSTKNDIVNYLGIKEKKIEVIYNGGSHKSSNNPVDPKKQTVFASSDKVKKIIEASSIKPYLLFIGGPEVPRRRLDHLISAYHLLRAEGYDLQLVFVGKELASAKSIPSASANILLDQRSYKEDIHLLGYVSDDDVKNLYKHALAFVFPTQYEGFGLPLIEAMEHNCLVISYNNSSIPEIVGDAGILIKPGYEEIAHAVKWSLNNPRAVKDIKAKGNIVAERFTWDATGKHTLELINKIIN